jgi:hypothetical protein
MSDPKCVLDRSLVNSDTLPMMKDIGLSIFASACGKNRGAFVLHPSNGHTYSCLELPANILDLVGIEVNQSSMNTNIVPSIPIFQVNDANAIKNHYVDGNLTASNTVDLLDFLVDNVYQSTSSVETDPYACDVSGLATLKCPSSTGEKKIPLRAVTMAGVFTPALWATGGQELTLEEASSFYTSTDFDEMKKLGLNTVQIPIPVTMFCKEHKHKHKKAADKWLDLLKDVLHQVRKADLNAILVLEDDASPADTVASPVEHAASFVQDYNDDHGTIITALVLPKLDAALLEAATNKAPDLNVWVPIKAGDVTKLEYFPLATGAALNFPHTVTVADVASSNSMDDRMKMYYHETMACISRAPLEYSSCFQNMPISVTTGFDLAVDNCHLQGISDTFQDYGQCDRFNETIDSHWWKDHRYSFAARQLYAYERGQGWSFAAWKLWGADPDNPSELDVPAKLLSFSNVVAAGIMPSLFDLDEPILYPLENASPVGLACLNPPNADFVMGDATHAPTPAPPPSCGQGWWNASTAQCDYWVPPATDPPTAAPPAPTAPPCPVCSNETPLVSETPLFSLLGSNEIAAPLMGNAMGENPTPNHSAFAAQVFFPGVMLSLMVSFFVYRVVGGTRRQGYVQVPDPTAASDNDQKA